MGGIITHRPQDLDLPYTVRNDRTSTVQGRSLCMMQQLYLNVSLNTIIIL